MKIICSSVLVKKSGLNFYFLGSLQTEKMTSVRKKFLTGSKKGNYKEK